MTVFIGAARVEAAPPEPNAAQERREDLAALTKAQLAELCAERGIEAPSRATKAQLVALLTE